MKILLLFLASVSTLAAQNPFLFLCSPTAEIAMRGDSTLPKIVYEEGKRLEFRHPEYGNWLTIFWAGRYSDGRDTEPIWNPNWTSIVTQYKPVVKKLPYGRYEITFSSTLTEGLP